MLLLLNAAQLMAQDDEGAWFAVDRLNSGLGAPPDDLGHSTPQGTLEALSRAAKGGDYATAAHLFDLRDIAPADQPEAGARLARQLWAVIDRKIVLDWKDLTDRPDAIDETATTESPLAGQARRSLSLGSLDIDERPVPIRLNRLKPGDGDPVWVVARETVANVPELFALYRPSWIETRMPEVLRNRVLWGLMWWELVALPILALLAALVGVATVRLLAEITARTQRRFIRNLVRAIRTPVVTAIITSIVAIIGKSLFVFSGPIDTVLNPAIALGYLIAAMSLVIRVVDVLLDRIVTLDNFKLRNADHKAQRELATKLSAGRRALIVVVFLIGAGMVLAAADVLNSFGFSLLASAGALTLILGFAARKVLGNIMASMQIAMNQSARIGDRLLFRNHLCDVERINFTYVQLRDWTGVRHIVPVEEFLAEPFENWSLNDQELIRLITLRLAHDADTKALRRAFHELIEDVDPELLGGREGVNAVITAQDAFSKEMTFCLPCSDPDTAWQTECDMREALIDRARQLQSDGASIFPDLAAQPQPG